MRYPVIRCESMIIISKQHATKYEGSMFKVVNLQIKQVHNLILISNIK